MYPTVVDTMQREDGHRVRTEVGRHRVRTGEDGHRVRTEEAKYYAVEFLLQRLLGEGKKGKTRVGR